MKESDLYAPLKQYLESRQYEIKGEIGECDVFAVRHPDPPLVVELKLSLNLTVILQAVDRLRLTSSVYVGVPRRCSALRQKPRQIRKLLRMLGIGLISIDPGRKSGAVKILLDPGDYRPRVSKTHQARLLGEFDRRVGDPNTGGADTRQGRVTAYRQDALKIALLLQQRGPSKAAEVALGTRQQKARDILYRDVYGWFDRVSRGIYALSPRGRREVPAWRRR